MREDNMIYKLLKRIRLKEIKTERIRPVIIVVENSSDLSVQFKISQSVHGITDLLNKRAFVGGKTHDIIVDIFQLSLASADAQPNLVKSTDLIYSEKTVPPLQESINLDPLFNYLVKLEHLNNRHKYLQPVVLFIMDASNDYIYSSEKLALFKRSYIYNNAFRVVGSFGHPTKQTEKLLKVLKNLTVRYNFQEPWIDMSCLFSFINNLRGHTDVIHGDEDLVLKVINGKIRKVKPSQRW